MQVRNVSCCFTLIRSLFGRVDRHAVSVSLRESRRAAGANRADVAVAERDETKQRASAFCGKTWRKSRTFLCNENLLVNAIYVVMTGHRQ